MTTVLAVSLNGKVELYTNGNHAFWVRPTTGPYRNRYAMFAGRTLASSLSTLYVQGAK